MCCLSVGVVDSADTTLAEEPVYFADTIVKTIVERTLGISDPTPTDMLALTTLNANNWSITDLTGLEYATNLTVLELVNHRISDISAIAGLKNLTELSLGYNRISDISAVAGLTRLTRLSLSRNKISDICAVAGLTNLTELYLYDNQISDMSAVAGLTNLSELYLYGNRIGDISTVAGLTNLTELHLGENQISDISATARLTNLTRLSLNNNRISDISAVAGLTNLTHLRLHDNQISDISGLLGLTNLTYLNLRRNPLSQNSCDIYIPQIRENNPRITIYYDPYVQHTLTTSSTAGGSVSVPGEGVFPYDYGGIRPIVASADSGYHFVFWTGTAVDAGSVANPAAANTTIRLYSDYTLKAHFAMDRGIVYVDEGATGSNDGSSWADAYTYLQDALTDANNSPKPVEVQVAEGTYKPDRGIGITRGDHGATFKLINSVTLKGGYAGSGEPHPNARDIKLHETILSGDLDGDDADVYKPGDFWYDRIWSDNSYHVVTARETNESAVLDGFKITGGYCLGPPPIVFEPPAYYGGGMVMITASPTVVDCTFAGNAVTTGGGALANLEGSSPTLVNCKFERNYSAWHGGGISNTDSTLTLIECRFFKNAAGHGAGISCMAGDLTATACQFTNNVGRYAGGGIFCDERSRVLSNDCSFVANSASSGGAIAVPTSDPTHWPPGTWRIDFATAENCIFAGNTATRSAAAISGSASLRNCTLTGNRSLSGVAIPIGNEALVDCILWGNFEYPPGISGRNLGDDLRSDDSSPQYCPASTSDAKHRCQDNPLFARAGYWADADDTNIAADPNDLNAIWVDGDYHLRSQAGRWEPGGKTWVQDEVTSPCIDTGDPASPIGHEPFPNGGIINMGAYGGTEEASKSYFGEPLCETIIAGDINGDCKVDFLDFTLLARHWLEER